MDEISGAAMSTLRAAYYDGTYQGGVETFDSLYALFRLAQAFSYPIGQRGAWILAATASDPGREMITEYEDPRKQHHIRCRSWGFEEATGCYRNHEVSFWTEAEETEHGEP